MADEFIFNEGKDAILAGGLTSVVSFALSTKKCGTQQVGEHLVTDTYAGGFAEITGTGYARITVNPRPDSVDGIVSFDQISWDTGAATDWPATCRSAIIIDSNDKLVYACNLQAGGDAVDMSAAGAILAWTQTFFIQNVGGGY